MTLRASASSRGALVSAAFGPVLRRLREQAGQTQARFCELAGIDRSFVSQIERGIRQPTLATFIAIAGALRIDPARLMALTLKELKATTLKVSK